MQSLRDRIGQVWVKWRGWILFALVLVVVVVLLVVLVWTGVIQTGFGEYTPPTSNTERAKTLWDWMDLLLVPLLLALGAWLLNRSARTREQEAEERRTDEQQRIELDRSNEKALQTYLDRMTELIKDGLRESGSDDPQRSIARARTMTALRQLDGLRNDLLLRFLHEAGLMGREGVISLHGAYLEGARLRGAILREVNLRKANLRGANLQGADLLMTDLRGAKLVGANLRGANLRGADLTGAYVYMADLRKADLSGADLRQANLRKADLREARLVGSILREADLHGASLQETNLRGANLIEAGLAKTNLLDADLSGAKLRVADLTEATVTKEQLNEASSLEGATLPDGTVHE